MMLTPIRLSHLLISAACIGLTLLLSGCTVTIPQQTSLETGIFTAPPEESPAKRVVSGPWANLGVLLSENTIQNIKYLQQRFDNADSGNPIMAGYIRRAKEAAVEPRFLVDWVSTSLKRRFGTVTVYEDLATLRAAQPDAAAIIDFFYIPGDWGRSEATARITVPFYDGRLRYIGKAQGSAAAEINGWSGDAISNILREHHTRVIALQRFDRSLDKLLAPPISAALADRGR